jgi:outer membrane protein OmpA-like peptidoglycan-associated protein
MALQRWTPAPAGDRMFGVQSPFSAGKLDLHVMLMADYAHNPLVLRSEASDETLGAIVGHQLYAHLNVSLSLFNRLNINVDVPGALFQSGDDPSGDGRAFPSPTGVDFGDLRAGLRIRLVGDYYDMLQLGIGGYVWIPTGTGAFVTDKAVRGLPQLIVGGRGDRVVWSIAAGPEIRPSRAYEGVTLGTTITGGAGVGLLFGEDRNFQIGPEVTVSAALQDPGSRNINAEMLVDLRYRFAKNFEFAVGAGPALSAGIGSPDVRAVATFAYTPEVPKPIVDQDGDGIADAEDACPTVKGVRSDDPKKNGCPLPPPKPPPPPDRDKDGIIDAKDACPDVAGVADPDPKKNGCPPPPPDRDKDGIIDDNDACPDVAGVASDDPKKNGCPPDRDGDGVPDAEDACPDLAGIKTTDPTTNGCPGDTDGDTIRDDKDACPNEKGAPDPDPKQNGCPKAVRVTETEIIILQQVQFDFGKSTIKPVSNPLLDEVASVLAEHPEILKLEVQGHTDDRGPRQLNTKLSQARADSVVKALEARKIDPSRMVAQGYGPDVPLDPAKTEAARAKNRRVQFKILEKKPKEAKP